FFGMDFPASEPVARPTVTFADTLSVYRNGQTLRLAHVAPAHTDSDILIHFEEANVLVAGDLFFSGAYPFIDYSSGGSLDGMIAAAGVILAHADDKTRIVPGHGPLAGRAEFTEYRDMMQTARDRLAKLARGGVSLADAVAQRPLADLDPTWGNRFLHGSNFIHVVYPAMIAGMK